MERNKPKYFIEKEKFAMTMLGCEMVSVSDGNWDILHNGDKVGTTVATCDGEKITYETSVNVNGVTYDDKRSGWNGFITYKFDALDVRLIIDCSIFYGAISFHKVYLYFGNGQHYHLVFDSHCLNNVFFKLAFGEGRLGNNFVHPDNITKWIRCDDYLGMGTHWSGANKEEGEKDYVFPNDEETKRLKSMGVDLLSQFFCIMNHLPIEKELIKKIQEQANAAGLQPLSEMLEEEQEAVQKRFGVR